MAKGNYLVQGDMTTCGGKIVDGACDHLLFGKAVARERDRVICGQHPGIYMISGGIANDTVHGRKMAGTLDSTSTCPCRARFIPSMMQDTYEKGSGSGANAASNSEHEATSSASSKLSPAPGDKRYCTHTDGAIKVAEYILRLEYR